MYEKYLPKWAHPCRARKLLLVMKLTTCILLLSLLQVSAKTLAQKVSLNATAAPLSAVFNQIEQQTGYDFAFTGDILQSAKPVTIKVSNQDLKVTLDQIFNNQPLQYRIADKSIVVTVKVASPAKAQPAAGVAVPQNMDVTGKVVDENNQPLPGATVIVKGTSNSTITAANGVFTLKNVAAGAVVVVSFVGYDKKEVVIGSSGDLGVLKMVTASSKLDEVVVQAYSNTTQRLSVGNVTTISQKTIENQPINNPLLALEAQVPGLVITQTSGIPGAKVNVQIQGQNSIANGNQPFYVIDGVPYTTILPTNFGGIPLNGGDPFSFINPSDIESISVLKDAAATAIYGSQAANGAILITTKKGKAGELRVDFDIQQGTGKVSHFLQMLNTPQYLEMRREGFKNNGLPVPSIITSPDDLNTDINGVWDTTRYTDWQKTLIGGTAHYSNFNGSISGGNTQTQFLISGTYHRETTVFPIFDGKGNSSGNIHFSLNSASQNQKFKVQLTGSFMSNVNNVPASDPTAIAFYLPPDAPALYNPDGTVNWGLQPNGTYSFLGNPLQNTLSLVNNSTKNFTSNLVLSYELIKGLVLKSNFGYTNLDAVETTLTPITAIDPVSFLNGYPRNAIYTFTHEHSFIIEPSINYARALGKGKLDVLVGASAHQQNLNSLGILGIGYSSDAQLADLSSATQVFPAGTTQQSYKYAAVYGRANYNLKNEFLVDLTFRRDGSSRFGAENEYHSFYAAGGAWIFTEEKWLKQNLPWLSLGKLKASYGTTGNDQIPNNAFLNLYYSYFEPVAYQGVSALNPSSLTNPFVQWEETRKLNFGLDLGVFNDRITFGANYYRNRSSNQLLSQNLPGITGFNGITANLPATVQNSGWELLVNTVNIKSAAFSWSTSINLTPNPVNKLLSYPGLAASGYNNVYFIGKPIGYQLLYHFTGVDPQTGLYTFEGADGKLTSTPDYNKDRTVFINTAANFYGGMTNTLQYKGLSLNFTLQYQRKWIQNYASGIGGSPGSYLRNQPVAVLNRWQNPGDHAAIQKFDSNGLYDASYSSYTLSDKDWINTWFLRLRNVAVSWTLPKDWQAKMHLRSATLFVHGQNLGSLTNYTGPDPETTGYGNLPTLRVWTVGFHVGL